MDLKNIVKMSHDVIADGLNNIMNAKRAGKESVVLTRFSKVLIKVLEIAKENNYIKDFKEGKGDLEIIFDKELNLIRSIKPRNNVTVKRIEFYMRRYLPAKDMGVIVISTNKGLMTHKDAFEKNLGGSLIAYMY